MTEQDTRGNEIATAFNAGRPYIERKLVTSDKWVAGTNMGGIFFDDIREVPMSLRESVANSKVGQVLSRAGTVFVYRR